MPGPLENLRSLRDDMRRRDWVITCFPFSYKARHYFVLPQLYVPPKVTPEYQLLELTFIDRSDLSRTLTAPANTQKINIDPKRLRMYFGIEWAPNLGDLLAQFSTQFGSAIPERAPEPSSPERALILQQLDRSEGEDPRKVYCKAVRRNSKRQDGSPGQRTQFNAQKTQLLRPHLYARLKHDQSLSFCYSDDPKDERSDEQILARFASP